MIATVIQSATQCHRLKYSNSLCTMSNKQASDVKVMLYEHKVTASIDHPEAAILFPKFERKDKIPI